MPSIMKSEKSLAVGRLVVGADVEGMDVALAAGPVSPGPRPLLTT
jgi:hypothetical protein